VTDVEAVLDTVARYCQLCDDGRFEEWAELFSDDAEFAVMGQVHRGPAAIRDFISAAMGPEARGRHITANPVVEVDGDTATTSIDYLFVKGAGASFQVINVGRYNDVLVRDGDRWLFAKRSITMLGS